MVYFFPSFLALSEGGWDSTTINVNQWNRQTKQTASTKVVKSVAVIFEAEEAVDMRGPLTRSNNHPSEEAV